MTDRISFSALTLLLVASAACSTTPAQPTASASTAGTASAALTGSVTSPRPLTPANGAQIRNLDQPVTLAAQNALVTKPGATTYTFEVASDAAFGTIAQTKDAVAEGTNGQTTVKLDALAPAKDYFWHVRATSAGTVGIFSAASRFTIGAAISVSAPVPIGPINGAATGARPALRATNAVRSGPTGPITYKFEVATSSGFTSLLISTTVSEGVNETGLIPQSDLPAQTTLFWRVTAIDAANNVSSPASAVQSFVTSLTIDLNRIITSYTGAPSGNELATSWKQTGTITSIEQDGNPGADGIMCVAFSTVDDWPSIPYFGDPSVPIYANQWYFANINGQWYGGPGEYLRSDRGSFCKTGQGTNAIGPDGGWTGPLASWAPRVGELVGYMITTPARAGMRSINERTNIILQPWRDTSLGSASTARKRQ